MYAYTCMHDRDVYLYKHTMLKISSPLDESASVVLVPLIWSKLKLVSLSERELSSKSSASSEVSEFESVNRNSVVSSCHNTNVIMSVL